jgi:tetratricopeptide (TPR) repeat protein
MKVAALAVMAALAIGASAAGAAERFRPAAADVVVLTVPARSSDDPIAVLEREIRNGAPDARLVTELASLYLQRARQTREPRYFTRAEALVQPWIGAPTASAALLNVQADILQNRHDFAAARAILDRAVRQDPRNAGSRLLRATVNGVQGHFDQARADCLALLGLGETTAGSACLAQMLGSTGRIAEAIKLLQPLQRSESASASLRAWALGLLADFADRRGDAVGAERYLRQALALEPHNETVRTALCDLLIERNATSDALALLDLPNPSYGLLVRVARIQALRDEPMLARTRAQLAEIEQLAARRGDVPHWREQALLALDVERDDAHALTLAKANFEAQRETIDVRLLARAARARGDRATLIELRLWLEATGFEDRDLEALRS